MLLVVDIGNTNVHLGIVKEGKLIKGDITIKSDVSKTAADYFVMLSSLININMVKNIIISSVVPRMTEIFREFSKSYLKTIPMVVAQPLKTGIKVIAENPKEVGADLIAAAAGIGDEGNYLIVDLGTANKFIYVKDHTITGVIISPGLETGLKGLINNTALLPSIEIKKPKKILGNNTIECMQSGMYYGTIAYINGMVDIIRKDLKEDFEVILTGGNSQYFINEDLDKVVFDKNLIFNGLINIYNRNKKHIEVI